MPLTIEEAAKQVKKLSTEELKKEFNEGLRVTRDRLTRLAAILVELESRGEKIDDGRHRDIVNLLRKIGEGKLMVEVAIRFAGNPAMLAILKCKPLTVQKEWLAKTDKEIADHFRTRGHGQGPDKFLNNKAPGHRETGDCLQASLKGLAAGSVKDIAEAIIDLVDASDDPPLLAAMLIPKLEERALRQKTRQLEEVA